MPRTDAHNLIREYQRTRDPRLREQLVHRYLPLARSLARRFASGGEPLEDLEQVAALALVKAVDGFDAERGTAFSSYAVPSIAGAIKRHFRDHGWSVRVPRELQERAMRVHQLENELSGSSPPICIRARSSGLPTCAGSVPPSFWRMRARSPIRSAPRATSRSTISTRQRCMKKAPRSSACCILIGETAFQEGMRRYFERHDGQAVTCEDFVAAMADAWARISGSSAAGTPRPARPASRSKAPTTPRRRASADRPPVDPADARPGGEAAHGDPAGARAPGSERAGAAPAARRRGRARRHLPRPRAQGGRAAVRLSGRARGAGRLAPARLLGAGRARERRRRRAPALPDRARSRPVRALGIRPDLCPGADAGSGRPAPAGAGPGAR